MTSSYFHKIHKETPTRVWVNNPTASDLKCALAAGAISGTTNPSYCSKLIQREPTYIRTIIDNVIRETEDDEVAADLAYQRATARFMEGFLPLYERSGGTEGFVTMQDNPNKDEDPDLIVNAALRHSRVGKNYMAKIPAIEPGMEAMVSLVERDIPICATECFTLSQTIAMCELYEQISRKCGKRPAFFITHITGIYDEELKAYVEREKVDIAPGLLDQAGCIVARREYRLLKDRGYHATMLGGGARGPHHFTELVGGDVHVTLNWSTMEELMNAHNQVIPAIDREESKEVIDELSAKLPDFRRACSEDGYAPNEFKDIPALQRFRNSFLAGWNHLMEEIAARRALV